MDDLLFPGLLVLGLGGWVLGIAGFVQARRALLRIRALELRLARPKPAAEPGFDQPDVSVAPSAADQAAYAPVAESLTSAVAGTAVPDPHDKADSFEARLTMRLGVWLGAAALLLAGVFLVRYAAEAGLLGPSVRCCLAALLGSGLLVAGARAGRRGGFADGGSVDYVPGALAAGGVAALLAAAYGAGPLYQLVPPPVDFLLLAVAALVGLATALRLGRLVAAVGLAGAYATPILAEQPPHPSYAGLFLYLAVINAAASAVVRFSGWIWLGWASTLAGALYVVAVSASLTPADVWPAAGFVPFAAGLTLLLLPRAALEQAAGRRLVWANFAVLGASGLVLCAVVGDWTGKAGVLLLAPMAIARGASLAKLDRLPWLASGLFLLLLLTWAVPEWRATGEVVATDRWQVVLPGAWAPEAIQPMLITAFLMAAGFAAAGLWFERRAERRPVWSALTAAVPLLTLAVTYAQVKLWQTDAGWAAVTLLLAAALVLAARRAPDLQAAGVHAAGAVGAIALGFAMLLTGQWLSMALALLLPPLAWIGQRSELPALRRVALVLAGLVLVRLLLNWFVLDYALGSFPVVNFLLTAYGVPAGAFALAARLFRKTAQDLTTGVLELGSVGFSTVLVVAEIHSWATGGALTQAPVSFLEDALEVAALAVLALAVLRINHRVGSRVLNYAACVLGTLAGFGAAALLIFNPALTGAAVGHLPVLDALLPAYAVPGCVALIALRQSPTPRRATSWLGAYALVAGFAWVTLEIRHAFHVDGAMGLTSVPIGEAELWAYSGVWLAYGTALLTLGIARPSWALRRAGLAVIASGAVKVFLVDMGGLSGLWRVMSFLGLGLLLIGLGAAYRRFVVMPANSHLPE